MLVHPACPLHSILLTTTTDWLHAVHVQFSAFTLNLTILHLSELHQYNQEIQLNLTDVNTASLSCYCMLKLF